MTKRRGSRQRERPRPQRPPESPARRPAPSPSPAAAEMTFGTDRMNPVANEDRPLRHPVWVHEEAILGLRERPALFQRLGLIIEQLGATGRTSVTKTCAAGNKGWYRTPLGGTGGNQFYLWWTRHGASPAAGTSVPDHGIAIRAARHHDDHGALEVGPLDRYRPVLAPADMTEDVAGCPWTEEQSGFTGSSEPVRVLEGRPGSGKTTALWHSVDCRNAENVLYVTWSTALADDAQRHFASFAPSTTTVRCIDHHTLIEWCAGRAIERLPIRESRARFGAATEKLDPKVTGPWNRYRVALYDEVRGILLGQATPDWEETREQDGCLRLSEKGYRKRRAQVREIEEASRRALLRTVAALPGGVLREAFPELQGAVEALLHLSKGTVPDTLAGTDRIVVDEVQDLTLTETSVIVELCRAIGKARGKTPYLLLAGDEGQTVRPSGFQWAGVRDLLTRRLRRPAVYELHGQVRCPETIAKTIEMAADLYQGLEKNARPKGQHAGRKHGSNEGRLMSIGSKGSAEEREILTTLCRRPEVTAITAGEATPEWLDADDVLTPAEAKGLEFQTVLVLETDRAVARAQAPWKGQTDRTLDHEARRNAVDQLRVALSRSTDTLMVLHDSAEGVNDRTLALLQYSVPYVLPDLEADLDGNDQSVEEQALRLSREAADVRLDRASRSLVRGYQAVRMLGDGERPGGVADQAIRDEVTRSLLETCAWHGLYIGSESQTEEPVAQLMQAGQDAIETRTGVAKRRKDPEHYEKGGDGHTLEWMELQLLDTIVGWRPELAGATCNICRLASRVQPMLGPERDWTCGPLLAWSPQILAGLKGAAADEGCARLFLTGDVRRWVQALDDSRDAAKDAQELAGIAFDTLMKTRPTRAGNKDERERLDQAERILVSMEPNPMDGIREARIDQAEGRIEDAANGYQAADATEELQELMRSHALWEKSSDGNDRRAADARWLLELEQVLGSEPEGLKKRMTKADTKRFKRMLSDRPRPVEAAKR